MQVIKISQWVLRISAIIVLILGILFWTNVIDPDTSGGIVLVHMLLGILVVLALWTMGIAQGLRGGGFGLALATFVWGLLTLGLGLFQQKILPDPSSPHWIIQVLHLILGLGAIGLGEMVAGRAKRQASKPVAA
jgi:hypothetical protein